MLLRKQRRPHQRINKKKRAESEKIEKLCRVNACTSMLQIARMHWLTWCNRRVARKICLRQIAQETPHQVIVVRRHVQDGAGIVHVAFCHSTSAACNEGLSEMTRAPSFKSRNFGRIASFTTILRTRTSQSPNKGGGREQGGRT